MKSGGNHGETVRDFHCDFHCETMSWSWSKCCCQRRTCCFKWRVVSVLESPRRCRLPAWNLWSPDRIRPWWKFRNCWLKKNVHPQMVEARIPWYSMIFHGYSMVENKVSRLSHPGPQQRSAQRYLPRTRPWQPSPRRIVWDFPRDLPPWYGCGCNAYMYNICIKCISIDIYIYIIMYICTYIHNHWNNDWNKME